MKFAPAPSLESGLAYKVARSNTDIQVFGSKDKNFPWLDNIGGLMETGAGGQSPSRVWVEWVSMDPGGSSTFELSVWDARHNQKVTSDSIVFKPFNSVVVVLSGDSQRATVPPPPAGWANGIIEFAVQEYKESGRDVYLYDEDDVSPTNGRGPVYDMIVSAINDRGVTNVAMVGYSHGGGKIYILSELLLYNRLPQWPIKDITKPFEVPFTAYIDAIEAAYLLNNAPETRRPELTRFHLSQYETNTPFLHGGPGNADIDVDRSIFGYTHWSIVNSSIVLGITRIYLRQKVAP